MTIDSMSSITTPTAATPPPSTSGSMPIDKTQKMPSFNVSAPGSMSDPFNFLGSGNDVYSKTYLALNWMIGDPDHSTNDPIVFLYYLSSVCSVENEQPSPYNQEQFDNFATALLSIQNDATPPKTLIDECVDITMEQMIINGSNADNAKAQIDALFPGTDRISVAVQNEAAANATEWDKTGTANITQTNENTEWKNFITNAGTIKTTKDAEADMRTSLIKSCGSNLFAAIIVILMLLQAAGIENMDAYGALSSNLQKETDELNAIITEWRTGTAYSTADNAQDWMNQLQTLQNEMDNTPFSEDTINSINLQFTQIDTQPALTANYFGWQNSSGKPVTSAGYAVDPSTGYQLFEIENSSDNNGKIVYYNTDTKKYYEYGSNPPKEMNKKGSNSSYTAVYWSDDSTATKGLTDGTGTTMNDHVNPKSTNKSAAPVPYNNYLYIDPNNHFLYTVSATGEAPSGAKVYSDPNFYSGTPYYLDNSGNVVFLKPPSSTTQLTLGDQAYHGSDYHYVNIQPGNHWQYAQSNSGAGTDANLQTTMKLYQTQPVNPNKSSYGGFSTENEAIITSLNSLTGPLSAQSAIVGTEMQQQTSSIELYQNTFSNTMDQVVKCEEAINNQR